MTVKPLQLKDDANVKPKVSRVYDDYAKWKLDPRKHSEEGFRRALDILNEWMCKGFHGCSARIDEQRRQPEFHNYFDWYLERLRYQGWAMVGTIRRIKQIEVTQAVAETDRTQVATFVNLCEKLGWDLKTFFQGMMTLIQEMQNMGVNNYYSVKGQQVQDFHFAATLVGELCHYFCDMVKAIGSYRFLPYQFKLVDIRNLYLYDIQWFLRADTELGPVLTDNNVVTQAGEKGCASQGKCSSRFYAPAIKSMVNSAKTSIKSSMVSKLRNLRRNG